MPNDNFSIAGLNFEALTEITPARARKMPKGTAVPPTPQADEEFDMGSFPGWFRKSSKSGSPSNEKDSEIQPLNI
jgi:hypothetical protein